MWPQYLLEFIILILLFLGLFKARQIIKASGWEGLGFFIGIFFFVFFPLILASILQVVEETLPSFPTTSFPLVILLIYLVETYVVYAFLNLSSKDLPIRQNLQVSFNREAIVFWAALIFYFFTQIYVLFSSGVLAGGHWYRTRAEYLGDGGSLSTLLLFIIWATRFLIVAYTYELLRSKKLTLLTAGLVVLAVCAYEFFLVGNRVVILMFGIAGFFYIYNTYGKKILTTILLALIPVMIALGVYEDVRSQLFSLTPITFILALINEVTNQGMLIGAAKVFESTALLIMLSLFDQVGQTIAPINGLSFLKIFTWFIPRGIWGAKPLPVTALVGNEYLPGKGVSLIPLFWGEVHYNFGFWGFLIYPIILVIIFKFFNWIGNKLKLNSYVKFLLGFSVFRLPVSDIIVSAIIMVIMYEIIIIVWQILPKKKTLSPAISEEGQA